MEPKFYKCEICGNITELLHEGAGTMTCCGQPMTLLEANTTDAVVEKHVPVIEKTDNGFKVSVGEVAHPMEEAHYIEWIAVYFEGDKCGRKILKPGDAPESEFYMPKLPSAVFAYCNLHGLWKK